MPRLTSNQKAEAVRLYTARTSAAEIAELFKCSPRTVQKVLKDAGVFQPYSVIKPTDKQRREQKIKALQGTEVKAEKLKNPSLNVVSMCESCHKATRWFLCSWVEDCTLPEKAEYLKIKDNNSSVRIKILKCPNYKED